MGSRAVILAWSLAAGAGGCSFLIEVDEAQCERDLDCRAAGIGEQCVEGLCVAPGARDQGDGDANTDSDGDGPDAGATADASAATIECAGAVCEPGELCFEETCLPEDDAQPWLCEPAASPDSASSTGTVRYRVHVRDFVTDAPPANLRVRACRTNDIDCTDTVASFEAGDDSGDVELELPTGFMGFLDVAGDGMLATLYVFTRPVVADQTAKDLQVVSPDTLSVLAGFTGLEADDSRGLVILETFACDGVAAGGIHFAESKGNSVPFYIVNELPNVEVTATVRDEINDIAIGGFLNVEPGFSTFRAMLGEGGPVVAEWNAQVRANTVTYLDLHP